MKVVGTGHGVISKLLFSFDGGKRLSSTLKLDFQLQGKFCCRTFSLKF